MRNQYGYVDAMRGWAILMVVAVHQAIPFTALWWPIKAVAAFGQMGVQMFFVASAFTLCNSAAARKDEPNAVIGFYIRRFFRIAPMYYVGIALFWALSIGRKMVLHNYADDGFHYSLWPIVANMTFIHGFVPSAFNSVVVGGWSIGTEFAFYAAFPVLFATASYAVVRLGWAVLLPALVAAVGVNVAVQLQLNDISNNSFWYCTILNQLPVFLVGMIAYFAPGTNTALSLALTLIFGLLAFVAMRMAVWTMLPFIAGVCFMFFLWWLRGLEHPRLIERIGKASFSIYIIHFVFAWFATKALLKKLPVIDAWSNLSYPLALAFTVLVTYRLARITELYIEKPFVWLGHRLALHIENGSLGFRG